jgi:hypothetical protein
MTTIDRAPGANAEAIDAWDGPLYDRFVRFRPIVTTGLGAHGEHALRLYPSAGRGLSVVERVSVVPVGWSTICSSRPPVRAAGDGPRHSACCDDDLAQHVERLVSRGKSRIAADLEQCLTQLVHGPPEVQRAAQVRL